MRMRSLYDTSSKHKYDEKPRLFTHMKGMLTEARGTTRVSHKQLNKTLVFESYHPSVGHT